MNCQIIINRSQLWFWLRGTFSEYKSVVLFEHLFNEGEQRSNTSFFGHAFSVDLNILYNTYYCIYMYIYVYVFTYYVFCLELESWIYLVSFLTYISLEKFEGE